MRILPLLISSVITAGLVVTLNSKLLLPAPLGKLLSPQHGIWQNAESSQASFSEEFKFPQLTGKVQVYLDDRLVPHIFAERDRDLYFVQGFLHAKFRLWQMELQTHAAAGRASEIVGKIALKHDREFRRLGMVYAAESSLKEMEKDPQTKLACDSYTEGVNAYIASLTESSLPLEYKLMGYKPEKWSNLKSALFLKNMSENLAGHDNDFEMTNAKNYFSKEDFTKLYPSYQDSLDPIIPKGTIYEKASIELKVPADADSIYLNKEDLAVTTQEEKPDRNNGSNNWAVNGAKTKSGSPILCNDPHLGLNLPSLWYEMQLHTPELNVYGATFPGAPAVIIGYNDSCAWGVTNGGRDVRDYYEIKFKDESKREYWYDSAWRKTEFRYETILIKDSATYMDTVAYTVFGPVMYDQSFSGGRASNSRYFSVRWKAHDKSNELKTFMQLNRARNYEDYLSAISNMKTPGQNFAFANKVGDIAMRTQGEWPAKWKGQGDFIMPGTDSTYQWQAMIPFEETPFQYNPSRNFVSSANQDPADSSYPYYLGRGYPLYRGIIINRRLQDMNDITPKDMMSLQTNDYNVFAEMATPILLNNINESGLSPNEIKMLRLLKAWDYNNAPYSRGATVFDVVWTNFSKLVFDDEFKNAPPVIIRPLESTLLQGILSDTVYKFIDNINTTAIETLSDDITIAFKNSIAVLEKAQMEGRLEWSKFKDTRVNHLTKLEPLSRLHLSIGGGTHSINATKPNHGPSWRMIVSLTPKTEAYGVYPGGQNGNPGSRFYDNFIDHWASGTYYPLWMMAAGEEGDSRVQWKMSFTN
jgi:penicillin amidase